MYANNAAMAFATMQFSQLFFTALYKTHKWLNFFWSCCFTLLTTHAVRCTVWNFTHTHSHTHNTCHIFCTNNTWDFFFTTSHNNTAQNIHQQYKHKTFCAIQHFKQHVFDTNITTSHSKCADTPFTHTPNWNTHHTQQQHFTTTFPTIVTHTSKNTNRILKCDFHKFVHYTQHRVKPVTSLVLKIQHCETLHQHFVHSNLKMPTKTPVFSSWKWKTFLQDVCTNFCLNFITFWNSLEML